MYDFPDESTLWDVLSKSTNLVKSLKYSTTNNEPFLEIAKGIEETTNNYVSKRKGHHALNEHMKNIKSRMDLNKELLRTAISNVSKIKSELGSKSSINNRSLEFETVKDVNKSNIDARLNEVNKKIKLVMRDIRSKSKGSTRLEKMLEEYSNAMEETTELVKSVPSVLRKGELLPQRDKEGRLRIAGGTEDKRANDLLRSMSSLRLGDEVVQGPKDLSNSSEETGSWVDYEGFDTKEELERFKTLYKRMTGEDADADENSETQRNVTSSRLSNDTTETEDMEFI